MFYSTNMQSHCIGHSDLSFFASAQEFKERHKTLKEKHSENVKPCKTIKGDPTPEALGRIPKLTRLSKHGAVQTLLLLSS